MKNTQKKTIFETIKKYITKSGKSVDFISTNTGVNKSQIRSIINGQKCRLKTSQFINLCLLLNIYLPDFELEG